MQQLKVLLLVLVFVAVGCFSNVAYKLSVSGGVRNLLTWQVIANTVGILGVVALTWLYKLVPMHIAYPLVQALLIVAIQVVGAPDLQGEHHHLAMDWHRVDRVGDLPDRHAR